MPSRRVQFENEQGIRLGGILELPDSSPSAFGIFSHCFTCGKDLKAIARISRLLAQSGLAILRFDFTGLGSSQGHFPDTDFNDNLADVAAAIRFLTDHYDSPALLIGHSLGGAAMMATAPDLPSARGLVTIASPSTTHHLADYLARTNPAIVEQGEGEVVIGGRPWTLRKGLLESLRDQDLESAIRRISVPHLIMHPPEDDTLPFWHAERLFEWSGGDRTFVTLSGADHLLVDNPADVPFVAETIVSWFRRYGSETER